MVVGGSVFLGYELILEFLRHHDELNMRPKLVDHIFAMSLIGTVGGFMAMNSIKGAFQGFLFFGLNLGFLSYWAMNMAWGPGGGNKPLTVIYDADVTPEEKERFEMMDQAEILAHNMRGKPGYGLIQLTQKYQ